VSSGGAASEVVVFNSGLFAVAAGASVSGTLLSGGTEVLYGMATGLTLVGGELQLYGGAVLSGTAPFESGGTVIAESGYTADGFTFASGAGLDVQSGGVASGTVVVSGGYMTISGGGIASATVIGSGGSETILSGGSAVSVTISDGALDLQSGASISGGVVLTGSGELQIDGPNTPGILADGVTLSGLAPGDTVYLTDIAFDPTGSITLTSDQLQVTEGGASYELNLAPGNYAADAAVLLPDGNPEGDSDTVIKIGTVVTSGPVTSGEVYIVSSGQTASGLQIDGGLLAVLSGGTAVSASITSGGAEIIYTGGSDSGTTINSGIQYDYGTATGTIVSAGLQEVGGTAAGTIIDGGA
jgi:autotransporter passenger strand-loop-strand repeat protein